MTQDNSALVRRAIAEIWNRGDYGNLDEMVDRDIVIHGAAAGEDLRGHAAIVGFYSALHEAFPDIHFTVEDQIAAGDRVVTRWSAHATHQGEFQGIPAAGKPIRLTGIDIDRFVDGKVIECWPQMDELGLLRQLGAMPEPAAMTSGA